MSPLALVPPDRAVVFHASRNPPMHVSACSVEAAKKQCNLVSFVSSTLPCYCLQGRALPSVCLYGVASSHVYESSQHESCSMHPTVVPCRWGVLNEGDDSDDDEGDGGVAANLSRALLKCPHELSPEHVLKEDYVHEVWDPTAIEAIGDALSPMSEGLRVGLQSQHYTSLASAFHESFEVRNLLLLFRVPA
jgi:hypothetical protein